MALNSTMLSPALCVGYATFMHRVSVSPLRVFATTGTLCLLLPGGLSLRKLQDLLLGVILCHISPLLELLSLAFVEIRC